MRPDLDDYEELNEGNAPRSRAMSWLVLVVAVGGFVALAYYAYHSGSQSVRDGQVLVVKADATPIKGEPTNAGGEQFPNQDKTIYDAIGSNPESDNDEKEEKLLPDAEAPVIPQPAVGADKTAEAPAPAAAPKPDAGTTTSYVNDSLKGDTAPVDPVDAQSMKQPAPPVAPEAKEVPKPAAAVPAASVAPVAAAPAPKPTPAPATKPAPAANPSPAVSAPKMVNIKPANAPAEKPKTAAAKPATKPAAKPTAAATGSYQVQLGAFKSEAEAKEQWSKISARHGDVLKGSPIIVKADLPNGTFYRLRASGFSSSDAAKAACAKLSAAGQACFPAGK